MGLVSHNLPRAAALAAVVVATVAAAGGGSEAAEVVAAAVAAAAAAERAAAAEAAGAVLAGGAAVTAGATTAASHHPPSHLEGWQRESAGRAALWRGVGWCGVNLAQLHVQDDEAPQQGTARTRPIQAALRAAAGMRRVADAACSIPSEEWLVAGPCQACPHAAPLLGNTRITASGHFQDVRHLEIDVLGMQQSYAPGDVLAISYVNAQEDVEAFLSRCGLDGDAFVRVEAANPVGAAGSAEAVEAYVRDLVAGAMDIAGSPARRYFFEVARHFTAAEHEQERLEYFASPEGADDLYNYNQREHRSILEALDDFKSISMPLEWLLQLVPALQPRRFSISSSALAHPGRVHLTVAVVDYKTPYKRHKRGLCSSWLSSLSPGEGVTVPVWLEKGSLSMPASLETPLILVGPGTGVAPFRSFLQERQAVAARQGGQTVAPCMLFFGCRSEAADYYYRSEFEGFVRSGVLMEGVGLQVAFSRDQPRKRYVQHCIAECAATIWTLVERQGAVIYVAGSANKMPEDVAKAFKKVAQLQGGLSEADSQAWLRRLELSKRYHVEAWS